MPIIRVTKKQIQEANKAREAALQKEFKPAVARKEE